jgi:hypothetical protein
MKGEAIFQLRFFYLEDQKKDFEVFWYSSFSCVLLTLKYEKEIVSY